MKEKEDIRVHKIWLGLQVWEKFLVLLMPVLIGVGSGTFASALWVGKIQAAVDNHSEILQASEIEIINLQTQVQLKADKKELEELKTQTNTNNLAIVEMRAWLTSIKENTDRMLQKLDRIEERSKKN